jgi:L-methionine (R)-S-oxide reductase
MMACTTAMQPAFPRFPVAKGLCGSAVALRSVVNVGNVQEDPRWLTTFGTTRSEIIVPVLETGGQAIGLIDVESDVVNAFSIEDQGFLTDCAPLLVPLFRQFARDAIQFEYDVPGETPRPICLYR